MQTQIENWKQSLTPKERISLEEYTNQRYSDVNNHLRGIKENLEMEPIIKEIDSALSKFSFPNEINVYRSQGATILADVTINKIMDSYKYINSFIPYENYVSTTLKREVAIDHIDFLKREASSRFYLLMDGILPPNMNCGVLSGISYYPNEEEVLIMRNKQYNITEVILYDKETINLKGNFNELEELI